jgi:hypothetical protein
LILNLADRRTLGGRYTTLAVWINISGQVVARLDGKLVAFRPPSSHHLFSAEPRRAGLRLLRAIAERSRNPRFDL